MTGADTLCLLVLTDRHKRPCNAVVADLSLPMTAPDQPFADAADMPRAAPSSA